MSAIDLKIIIVETGNSTGSVAKPKAPPAPPEAVISAFCSMSEPGCGIRCILRNAIFSADSSPAPTALEITCLAEMGKTASMSSIGLPIHPRRWRAADQAAPRPGSVTRPSGRSFSLDCRCRWRSCEASSPPVPRAQVNLEQPLLEGRALHLDIVRQVEHAPERAGRDALVEVLAVSLLALGASDRQDVLLGREGAVASPTREAGRSPQDNWAF